MLKKIAILANGGDVAGFNAVIRGIVKTAENNGVEAYGFIDGYNGLLKNNYVLLSTAEDGNAEGRRAGGRAACCRARRSSGRDSAPRSRSG